MEYVNLGEVCDIKTGKLDANKSDENGIYPFFTCNENPLKINEYAFDTSAILISGNGSKVGHVNHYNGKFNAYQRTYVLDNFKNIEKMYLYYVLKNDLKEYVEKNSKKASIPYITLPMLQKIKIPLPSIEKQQKIADILDRYTKSNDELINNLKKECELRRKQYEYYRDKLLTFGDDVLKVRLKEIGTVSMCKRIFKDQTSKEGEVPFYKIGSFGKEADSYISSELFEEYKKKYPYPKKGNVLISASGTIGKTVIYNGEKAYYQDSNIVWLNHDNTKVLDKYLYYFYNTFPWKITEGGTIPRLYNDNILNTELSLPPLEKQMEIVSILEKYESMYNEVRKNILAEIEMREKQYSYYRNLLLNF